MPRRTDLETILIIGSGPIVIGQACEFDYSGTQACRALREEGYRVVLVNSNPATIMTDPETAHAIYVEPLRADIVEKVIARERPQALLPTLGGQTALNIAVALAESGALERHGVELIGASLPAIRKAEDRQLFAEAMARIGLDLPRGGYAHSVAEAAEIMGRIGYPVVLRPSFTLGGTGGGIAYNREELEEIASRGLHLSMIGELLVEECLVGWKEFELEVMRDRKDNVVVVCTIENVDPMGIHTGDSITVAPAQTLTDKEYQRMRDWAVAIMREVGVETGGSNIQFALHPETGRMVVIEMNPRVSRSSALASKATGFPIAKIAAKLSVGYALDEIPNDITRKTPSSFEPTIDYVVTKIPRWNFEKFPGADPTLTSQMKSVGEAMAIGRTFAESLQKALRSLEIDRYGLGVDGRDRPAGEELEARLARPTPERIFHVREALRRGMPPERIQALSGIDPWFLHQIRALGECEEALRTAGDVGRCPPDLLRRAKRSGFSDVQIAHLLGSEEGLVRRARMRAGIRPTYKTVDTCAGEFEAQTPYFYSTYEEEDEGEPLAGRKVLVLGGGPNRIGQGIEFDYCCVQACRALAEEGYATIMVNSNPETVSTDYDTADRLYFEPLTLEDVLAIVEKERPDGVIVQLGGQTPLKLALPLKEYGVHVLGTDPEAIDLAEDRERFGEFLDRLGIRQPERGVATSLEEAEAVAERIGFPVLVRPSYVLGGRAMVIVYDQAGLRSYIASALEVSHKRPLLIDRFVEDAFEADVDAACDGERVFIGGVMQHIEDAGIHSGDSACVLPPYLIAPRHVEEMKAITRRIALELPVIGLLNVQFAIQDETVYVLEVNPRASRTVPFVGKATGIPLARIGVRCMVGCRLAEMGLPDEPSVGHVAVKESVFPFAKFPGVDVLLGPEMRSTGEVMGIDRDFGTAFAKAQLGAGVDLPLEGTVIISVNDRDKPTVLPTARALRELGFILVATEGTCAYLVSQDLPCQRVFKVNEGRPDIVDFIRSRAVHLLINTPLGKKSQFDDYAMRRAALLYDVPYITTMSGAAAAVRAVEALRRAGLVVRPLSEYHGGGPGEGGLVRGGGPGRARGPDV